MLTMKRAELYLPFQIFHFVCDTTFPKSLKEFVNPSVFFLSGHDEFFFVGCLKYKSNKETQMKSAVNVFINLVGKYN